MGKLLLTGIAGRVIAEFVATIKGVAHTNPTPSWLVLPGHEPQLDLGLGRIVGVARIGGLEDGAGITTPRHEQLGRVVNVGELVPESANMPSHTSNGCQAHFATNDSANPASEPVDDTVDEGEIVCRIADWADEQVAIPTARDKQVHVLIMNILARDILDLESEGGRNGGRGRGPRDDTLCRRKHRTCDECRDHLTLHLVRGS